MTSQEVPIIISSAQIIIFADDTKCGILQAKHNPDRTTDRTRGYHQTVTSFTNLSFFFTILILSPVSLCFVLLYTHPYLIRCHSVSIPTNSQRYISHSEICLYLRLLDKFHQFLFFYMHHKQEFSSPKFIQRAKPATPFDFLTFVSVFAVFCMQRCRLYRLSDRLEYFTKRKLYILSFSNKIGRKFLKKIWEKFLE